jgi:hypothetical protein
VLLFFQLEEQQRLEQKVRKESGMEYPTAYFHKEGDSWVFNNLLCEVTDHLA